MNIILVKYQMMVNQCKMNCVHKMEKPILTLKHLYLKC